jgi:hypothetical protein
MDLQDERRWRVVERVIQPNSTQRGAIYPQVEASRESVEKQNMLMRVDDGVVVTESRLETPKHGGGAGGENSENFASLLPVSPRNAARGGWEKLQLSNSRNSKAWTVEGTQPF